MARAAAVAVGSAAAHGRAQCRDIMEARVKVGRWLHGEEKNCDADRYDTANGKYGREPEGVEALLEGKRHREYEHEQHPEVPLRKQAPISDAHADERLRQIVGDNDEVGGGDAKTLDRDRDVDEQA